MSTPFHYRVIDRQFFRDVYYILYSFIGFMITAFTIFRQHAERDRLRCVLSSPNS